MTDAPEDSTPELDPSTPTAAGPGPAKAHGDPLLAASQGASEGTEGTRHGLGAAEKDGEQDSDGQGAATPS